MSSPTSPSVSELDLLRRVVTLGFENAARGLSLMVDRGITVVSPSLRVLPIERVPSLVGEPDDVMVAIYLGVFGDVTGHILLLLTMQAADELVRMLLGESGESNQGAMALDEIERSALGEVANVTGSSFLTALADATHLLVQPSPPAVMIDMVGAVLDVALSPLAMSMGEILIIDTWFLDNEHQIQGLFLMLPNAESLRLIIERLETNRG